MTFATALLISVCLHGEGRTRILTRLSRFFFGIASSISYRINPQLLR